jgi:L-amino acid N-acyltransferase YncA
MINVRQATWHDLPAMLAIYNHIILHTTAVWQYEPHTLEMRQQWFDIKEALGHPVFVAATEGEIAGFSTFGPFRHWQGYRFTVENSIYVAEQFRGRGISKLLMPPLIDAARKLQIHAMVAGIEATNAASIALHEKFGFVEVAHFKEVGHKFGRWMDLKFLELIL